MSAATMAAARQSRARIVLAADAAAPAHLEATRCPAWAWALRAGAATAGWLGLTAAAVTLTLDPFLASLPFVGGAAVAWQAWHGRYRVQAFRGTCPGCGAELTLPHGSHIDLPCTLACHRCQRETQLEA